MPASSNAVVEEVVAGNVAEPLATVAALPLQAVTEQSATPSSQAALPLPADTEESATPSNQVALPIPAVNEGSATPCSLAVVPPQNVGTGSLGNHILIYQL